MQYSSQIKISCFLRLTFAGGDIMLFIKQDLIAYLAKFLTPEQIELLLGDPELISEELADKLFGGNTNHIVFKAAKNLFAK